LDVVEGGRIALLLDGEHRQVENEPRVIGRKSQGTLQAVLRRRQVTLFIVEVRDQRMGSGRTRFGCFGKVMLSFALQMLQQFAVDAASGDHASDRFLAQGRQVGGG
jgi:hypothetical protein